MKKDIVLIGYSGHAYVVAETVLASGGKVLGYLEKQSKVNNPFDLDYLGFEEDKQVLMKLMDFHFFPAIGSNSIRSKVYASLAKDGVIFTNVIHPAASVSNFMEFGDGILICRGVNINPLVRLGNGVVINTGSIIEHECEIDEFAHIGPGAVLAGNVHIGKLSFLGANSVVRQGIKIGENVIVGAGSVVINDVSDNQIVVGNPAKVLKK